MVVTSLWENSCMGLEAWDDEAELRWAARQWASRMGLLLVDVRIRDISRWGSLSLGGRLTLHRHLLQIPRGLGELVIVREIARNISALEDGELGEIMDSYLPGWKLRERMLASFNA
jgi:hypothetical protein